MSSKTISLNPPTIAAVTAARVGLNRAELSTIAAAVGAACLTLKGLKGATSGVGTALSTNVLRVIAKEPVSAIIKPLRDVAATPGVISAISTIRTAVVKYAAAYGEGKMPAPVGADDPTGNPVPTEGDAAKSWEMTIPALPVWATVAEAENAGNAALTGLLQSAISYEALPDGQPGKAHKVEEMLEFCLVQIERACDLFALSDKSKGAIKQDARERLAEMVSEHNVAHADKAAAIEGAEKMVADALESAAADTAAVIDEKDQTIAALRIEMAHAEFLLGEVKRIFGIEGDLMTVGRDLVAFDAVTADAE